MTYRRTLRNKPNKPGPPKPVPSKWSPGWTKLAKGMGVAAGSASAVGSGAIGVLGRGGQVMVETQRLRMGNVNALGRIGNLVGSANVKTGKTWLGSLGTRVAGKLGPYVLPAILLKALYDQYQDSKAAEHVASLVSTQRRDPKTGYLRIKDNGEFPFPYGLLYAMLGRRKVSSKVTEAFLEAMYPEDVHVFNVMFVPLASREDISRKAHENVSNVLQEFKSVTRKKIAKRVSEYDLTHRPDIVEFAADFPGTGRDSKWAVAYMKAKRVIPLPGSRTK